MCYNSCSWFHFNPMTGLDKCSLPKHSRCPEDLPVSNCCGAEIQDWPDIDICPECKEHTDIEGE